MDEGDIIKNDDRYAYIVSGDKKSVYIVGVYPAEMMEILAQITVNIDIDEIYVNDDRLVMIGDDSRSETYLFADMDEYYSSRHVYETHAYIYDIKDRTDPTLVKVHCVDGNFVSSRLIGNHLYLITQTYARNVNSEEDLPAPADDIYYIDEYDTSFAFTTIISLNIMDHTEKPKSKVILMGNSNNIYVSKKNILITYTKRMSYVERRGLEIRQVEMPALPLGVQIGVKKANNTDLPIWENVREMDKIIQDYTTNLTSEDRQLYYERKQANNIEFQQAISEITEQTMIHRISIRGGNIKYIVSGNVPGHLLNRFSMDEHDGHFRVATTMGWMVDNRLYVLDSNLTIIGKIENIAPGERIYSARFMGDRCYLVTFKKVDPFFVIDLGDPEDPEILGELKIPGYSDYLHPYDENHIIGIGKDTVDTGEWARFQGVKVSLFDVTDVHNPVEVDKHMIIGDRGTESLALRDPHAFMFSKRYNLLVIPITLYEHTESQQNPPPNTFGTFTWDGAYVLHVDEKGITEKGRISHDSDNGQNDDYYSHNRYNSNSVKRSFYIGNALYTVSDTMIKANNLDDLEEIKTIEFGD